MLALVLAAAAPPAHAAQAPGLAQPPRGTGTYAELVALHQELRAYMVPGFTSAVVLDSGARVGEQYADPLMAAKLQGLDAFDRRLQALDVASWPRDRQVDFLAVKSLLNGYRFNLEVLRPWKRDPGFYLDPLLRVAFTELSPDPARQAALRAQLGQIAPMLRQARSSLSELTADFTDLALFNLENSDGVNHYHPYRATPPAGIIGWYDDLLRRAQAARSPLLPEVRAARSALVEFRDWLRLQRPGITAASGVGPERFQWYITHVRMVPYSTAEMLALAEREHQRLSSNLALIRHRNRRLPELALSRSAAEQQAKIAATDRQVRDFLRREEIVTIPDFIGELGSNTPFIVRPTGPNFWEQIQFRDPIPDHLHAVIPGHRFDAELARRDQRPIRGAYADGVRLEGWAMYLEEAMMTAGAVKSPRAEELIQLFGIFRAARVPADIYMQHNRWNAAQAVAYMREMTPWLDEDVARVDAEIYLRRPPGYGLAYLIGKLQVDALLAERARQLGPRFVLREFHDGFLAAGRLPIALIRYEMTGSADQVAAFWVTPPVPRR
ncbi:MAG TPA: DUF885 family protein [Sphingomicrobium sp.]|nr:DUF885 family protein [Sphingomicrobium sp.]